MSSPLKQRNATQITASPSTPRKRKRVDPAHIDHIDKKRSQTNSSITNDMYNFGSTPRASTISNGKRAIRPNGEINPHTGAKKLVVKNLKPQAQWDSKAYLEKTWSSLDTALTIIFKNAQERLSREDLYKSVENVCRQGGASTIFHRLENRCRQYIQVDILEPLLQHVKSEQEILHKTLSSWKLWNEQMAVVHAIFFFLDRSYLLSSSKPTISELTVKLFRDLVITNDYIQQRVVRETCNIISKDRTGGGLDQETFSNAINMFNSTSVYAAVFEPAFVETTRQFIATWSRNAATLDLPQYVAQSQQIIANEMTRCDEFQLPSQTRNDLLSVLEEHIIIQHTEHLTNPDSLADLLDASDVPNLTALYTLLNRRRLGSGLRPGFDKWVNDTGTSIVFADNVDDMVVRLLSLQRQLDNIWQSAFQRDESIGHGLRENFENFMNKTKKGDATWGTDNTKVGEMIAKYVDTLLRGGAKAIPDTLSTRRGSAIAQTNNEEDNEDVEMDEDAEMTSQLDQVLDLFRYVHGKAVFEAFYKKDLAKRLLMARSASADAERSMLTRLKTECGSQFTMNLEQMFKDIELAREEMQSYKDRLEDRIGYEKGKSLDISVNILSAAAWPTYPDVPVVIPANIKKAIDDFELHYKNKHNGRKLDFKHSLAHCQMRATFPGGSKELVVSSFQAVVLLLFNGVGLDEELSYPHILSQTGLPEVEVKRTLQSLACAKLRPLTKHPKGREINDTDTFTINADFKHPKYRVKINQVQLKETKDENKETHMRVAEDRNFECQAAIVRIMKSRKTIAHSELVSEVIKATMSRGVLAVGDIKKNIDRLIEKDYMEREDGGGYSYVA